jgi:hypothetical protein
VKLVRPQPPDEPLPLFFTFVATGSAGVHMYGHCLTFYERLTPSQEDCLEPPSDGDQPVAAGSGETTPSDTVDPHAVALEAPAPSAPYLRQNVC